MGDIRLLSPKPSAGYNSFMGTNTHATIALLLVIYHEPTRLRAESSTLFDRLIPNLVGLAERLSKFRYTLYLGVDKDHPLNVDQALNARLKNSFLKISSKTKLRLKLYVDQAPISDSVEFWNELGAYALEDGSDYFFKISQDITFVSENWLERYIQILHSHPIHAGLGVVFPTCPLGELQQHFFVSRTHFENCGALYPAPLPLCYSGRWISEVYKGVESVCYETAILYQPDFVPEPREQPKQLNLWTKSVVEYLIVYAIENIKRWIYSIARTQRGSVEIPKAAAINLIHLIVQYFAPEDPQHAEEIKTCLKNNLENPSIDMLHVLTERVYDLRAIFGPCVDTRVKQVVVGKRLTYQEAFRYAAENLSGKVCIVSNSDIYFDDSLKILQNLDLAGKVLALTRYDVLADGTVKLFSLPGPACNPHIGSQDAWIFLAPITKMECDFELGQLRCDGRIAYIMDENDLEIINPCHTIRAMHLHRSEARKYDRGKRLEPPFLYVQHCEISQPVRQNQPTPELRRPSSIATIATSNALESLRLLLKSILIFSPTTAVVLLSDGAVAERITKEFSTLDIEISSVLERYSGKNRKQMTEEGIWSAFMLEKCSAIDAALGRYSDTLYVDSDVIFLDELPRVDPTKDIYLSPHDIRLDASERYGEFNGGYLWVKNKEFTKWWREETAREPKFFEQYCLNNAARYFKTGLFASQVNFGWWRLFLSERPGLRLNQFRVGKDGKIRFQNKPLQSIHTNFLSEEHLVKEFNNFFLGVIRNSKDPRISPILERIVVITH